jgi:phage baseplate assembly protein gpV
MKKHYSILIVMVTLIGFLPVAALAAGASGFPTWSQHLTKGRFTVLPLFGSAAVLDKETGLVWEKQPSTGVGDWFNRLSRCYTLEVGGRKGWRVPTIEELASLVDTSNSSPTLPTGHPFTLTSAQEDGFYWSATTRASNTSGAWGVDFNDGAVFNFDKSNNIFVWCVRGGQGIDGVQ